MDWKVGQAKQQLSEVLRQTGAEPQRIYSRNRFVAAVVSAELFEEFERWREARERGTLGGRFGEVQEICAAEEYSLETAGRRDRRITGA